MLRAEVNELSHSTDQYYLTHGPLSPSAFRLFESNPYGRRSLTEDARFEPTADTYSDLNFFAIVSRQTYGDFRHRYRKQTDLRLRLFHHRHRKQTDLRLRL